MNTYTATLPDGSTATRRSAARVYTYAVALPEGKGWIVAAWCSRRDLADRQCRAWRAGRHPYIKALAEVVTVTQDSR